MPKRTYEERYEHKIEKVQRLTGQVNAHALTVVRKAVGMSVKMERRAALKTSSSDESSAEVQDDIPKGRGRTGQRMKGKGFRKGKASGKMSPSSPCPCTPQSASEKNSQKGAKGRSLKQRQPLYSPTSPKLETDIKTDSANESDFDDRKSSGSRTVSGDPLPRSPKKSRKEINEEKRTIQAKAASQAFV